MSAASPSGIDRVGTTRTVFAVSASSCSATGMMFLLPGSTTTWSAGAASTAASSSAVDGFSVWPPVTIACTPSSRKSSAIPGPLLTATAAQVTVATVAPTSGGLALGVLGGDLLEQIGDADLARPPVAVEGGLDGGADVVGVDVAVPDPVAADDDDRVADLPPALLEVLDAVVGEVAEEHHLVSIASTGLRFASPLSAASLRLAADARPGRASPRVASAAASPSTTCRAASRSSRNPAPPASTTPASRRTGRSSGVRASAWRPRSRAARRTPARSVPASAAARRRGGGLAHHGEDRALDGRQHGAVGRRRGRLEPVGHGARRHLAGAFERRGQPAQDLRQDHPAVAPRPHQRAMADGVARGGEVGRRRLDLGDHGLQRARHVRAGVAVGHRVHVEPVDADLVVAHHVTEGGDGVPQGADGEAFQRPLERGHHATVRASAKRALDR